MMFQTIQAFGYAARHAADHGADQAVLLQGGELLWREQFDRLQAHFLAGDAKILEGDFVVAPFADGVVHTPLEAGADLSGGQTTLGQTHGGRRRGGAGSDFAQRGAAGKLCVHNDFVG